MNRKTTTLSLLTLGLLVGLVSCNHPQNPMHEHRLVKVDGDEPTCLSEYYKTYWKCDDCNMLFLDEAGTQETTVDNLKLPPENLMIVLYKQFCNIVKDLKNFLF